MCRHDHDACGLKKGRAACLTWDDIDLQNKTITVNKAVETDSNGNTFEIKHTTKTEAGMRTVNIPQLLVDFLQTQHKRNAYVCVNTKNEMHTQTSWRRMWESYLTDLNLKYGEFETKPNSKFDPKGVPVVIEHITPHMLRHTFATMLYMAGVDTQTCKEQMGHTDFRMTERYTHVDHKHKKKEMMKLDDFWSERL